MHGATMTDLTEDLSTYLENDPDYKNSIYATASRRTTAAPDVYKVSGISLTLSPAVVWLDTKIFEDYGVTLPTGDWTYDDVLSIAAQLTGTDPLTGIRPTACRFSPPRLQPVFRLRACCQLLGAKVFPTAPTLPTAP
jgi:ABC-type glycerol-3-phosphate transport system substrate-binding protein